MRLSDLKGVFKTSKVKFISAHNLYDDYYEIKLERPQDLFWESGEHAIFSIPGKKVKGKKWRGFSIASTSDENIILLGTRTGKNISSYKDVLLNMSPGELIKVRGPFGWFKVRDDKSPVVFIALGIGVTPIRSLLVDLEGNYEIDLNLIYSSKDFYMFKDRIDQIIDEHPNFKIDYTKSIDKTQSSIESQAKKYGNRAQYFISGSSQAIKSVKKQLKSLGIKSKNIVNDPFFGY